jgi:filamentous hemagglutinin family protein
MNSDRFRLVYSQYLNMFVPVPEATKSRGQKSAGKRMRSRHALTAALFSVAYGYDAIAAPPVIALPTAGVITSGLGSINTNATATAAATAMTVNQTTKNMIVNWGSFNIGSSASVNFVQPSSTSAVLNRVGTASGLSQIYGNLTANGQVYIINPNGILFGKGSTVNVNSLVASTLDISDNLITGFYLLPMAQLHLVAQLVIFKWMLVPK